MAYIEIVREDQPETLYCATFFLGKAGNVVPGGFTPTVEEAVHSLVHVLEGRDLKRWAPLVEPMTEGVVEFMNKNASLSWARFEIPDAPSHEVEPAIPGMTAGTSVRRREEYITN
jgi:hypothetical protein